jgi:hypothetical protein
MMPGNSGKNFPESLKNNFLLIKWRKSTFNKNLHNFIPPWIPERVCNPI